MEQEKTNPMPDELDRAVRDLLRIGRHWARHGLTVGQSALETSATTLRTTADLLGRLSSSMAEENGPHEEDDVPTADAS